MHSHDSQNAGKRVVIPIFIKRWYPPTTLVILADKKVHLLNDGKWFIRHTKFKSSCLIPQNHKYFNYPSLCQFSSQIRILKMTHIISTRCHCSLLIRSLFPPHSPRVLCPPLQQRRPQKLLFLGAHLLHLSECLRHQRLQLRIGIHIQQRLAILSLLPQYVL